jgi:hypothetical protein
MFKETCLVAHKRIDRSAHMKCLKIPRAAVAPAQNHLITAHNQSICNKEEDTRLGWCWATRPDGPAALLQK